jgi:CHASE3 domain sensor protein
MGQEVAPSYLTAEDREALSGLGKKLREVYDAMLEAYRQTKDKEQGAKAALEIYDQAQAFIEDVRGVLGDIEDLKDVLLESLKELSRQREKGEVAAKRIAGGGSLVSKLVPCGKHCNGCPHGPYLYRVVKSGGKLHWIYLGKA